MKKWFAKICKFYASVIYLYLNKILNIKIVTIPLTVGVKYTKIYF